MKGNGHRPVIESQPRDYLLQALRFSLIINVSEMPLAAECGSTDLDESRVLRPVLQSLINCNVQLLQDRKTETGLFHVGLMVEIIGSFRGNSQGFGDP